MIPGVDEDDITPVVGREARWVFPLARGKSVESIYSPAKIFAWIFLGMAGMP